MTEAAKKPLDIWAEELHQQTHRLGYKLRRTLYSGESDFQRIDVVETEAFGRMLLNDSVVMLSERDEWVYHEMISHVAIFVHPDDMRYQHLHGEHARVPFSRQVVPILTDRGADPEKGTGAVMCCTFGDQADVAWWYSHKLSLKATIDRDGRLTEAAGGLVAASYLSQLKKSKV